MRSDWKYPELWPSQATRLAWCPSNGVTWNTLTDYSGTGNVGAMLGMDPATDWVPNSVAGGRLGLDFDGVDDRVEAVPSATFTAMSVATVSGWVYPRQTANFYYRFGFASSAFDDYRLSFRELNSSLSSYKCKDGGGTTRSFTGPSLTVNKWSHVSLVADTLLFSAYVNGALVGSVAKAAGLSLSNAGFSIARQYGTNDSVASLIADDLSVVSVVRSFDEISLLASRRGIAYETVRRRSYRAASAAGGNRRRRVLIGAG